MNGLFGASANAFGESIFGKMISGACHVGV